MLVPNGIKVVENNYEASRIDIDLPLDKLFTSTKDGANIGLTSLKQSSPNHIKKWRDNLSPPQIVIISTKKNHIN